MSGAFGWVRSGTWSVSSKSDPRWNGSGRANVGGFMKPPEVDTHIDAMRYRLGEEPPGDLEWGYMKDCMSETTDIRYQVEAFGIVQDSNCASLAEARCIKARFVEAGAKDAQIARFDISPFSDYYVVVE